MSLSKILISLDKSWERDNILLKIKNGKGTDEIVNEFLMDNEVQVKELNSLLRSEDIDLLNQIEKLSNCEAKLINKIYNFNYFKNKETHHTSNEEKKFTLSDKVATNKIKSFMMIWSNKFVVIALLIISAVALSKQAWT